MATAAPADGNPGMPFRLLLVPGQQGRGGSGRSRHAVKNGSQESGSCESIAWWANGVAVAECAAVEGGHRQRPCVPGAPRVRVGLPSGAGER